MHGPFAFTKSMLHPLRRSGRRPRVARRAACLLAILLLAACSQQGLRPDEGLAQEHGFDRRIVVGQSFRHVVYAKRLEAPASRLHVYIEHDGSPWLGSRVALDPSPRDPLALRLMALDPEPAIYLGRPCYLGLARDAACSPLHWTHRRYAEEVVASMAAALGVIAAQVGTREIVLIGVSGGGTLAVLIAQRMEDVVGVLTVAANLDVGAWTGLHGYSELEGSLDPALQPILPRRIVQQHYVGGRDRNVPPSIVRAYAQIQPGAEVIEIAQFDHRCCWDSRWESILDWMRARLEERR